MSLFPLLSPHSQICLGGRFTHLFSLLFGGQEAPGDRTGRKALRPANAVAPQRWCGLESAIRQESEYSPLRQTGWADLHLLGTFSAQSILFFWDRTQALTEAGCRSLDTDLETGSWSPSGCRVRKGDWTGSTSANFGPEQNHGGSC